MHSPVLNVSFMKRNTHAQVTCKRGVNSPINRRWRSIYIYYFPQYNCEFNRSKGKEKNRRKGKQELI